MVNFRSLNELDATEGTVTLIDSIIPSLFLLIFKAAGRLNLRNKPNSDLILIPQPSNDINDPLNWPTWKKACAVVSVFFFSAFTNWAIVGGGNIIVLLMKEFHKDLTDTSAGTVS